MTNVKDTKLDRRVQKTRQALQDALVALILEKGYEAVMVQDILDRANVGRSTFYAHYQDKEALLMARFERLQMAFDEHFQMVLAHSEKGREKMNTAVNLPLFILHYVENEQRLFKALFGKRGSGTHANFFQHFLVKYTRDIVKTQAQARLAAYQIEIVVQYITNAFLALLVWWVDNDLPCSVEDLYAIMMRLIEPGLKDVLETTSLWS